MLPGGERLGQAAQPLPRMFERAASKVSPIPAFLTIQVQHLPRVVGVHQRVQLGLVYQGVHRPQHAQEACGPRRDRVPLLHPLPRGHGAARPRQGRGRPGLRLVSARVPLEYFTASTREYVYTLKVTSARARAARGRARVAPHTAHRRSAAVSAVGRAVKATRAVFHAMSLSLYNRKPLDVILKINIDDEIRMYTAELRNVHGRT